MYLYDNTIIYWAVLLLDVCNRTEFLFQEVIFIRFCNTRYHTITGPRL